METKNPENTDQKNPSAGQPQQPSLSVLHYIPKKKGIYIPLPFTLPCGVMLGTNGGVTGTRDPNAVTCEKCKQWIEDRTVQSSKETTDGASPSEGPGAGNGNAGKQKPAKIRPLPDLFKLEARIAAIEERHAGIEDVGMDEIECSINKYRRDTIEVLRDIANNLRDIAGAQLMRNEQ